MGLFDTIREALGVRATADASRDADPEDLFGMSTAYVTMAADLDYRPAGEAALYFRSVDSTAFRETVEEVRAILAAGREETGTEASVREDSGGQWVVLEDEDFEDLVTSAHFAADTLVEADFGSRLLVAMFAFERPDGGHAYWVYSFRRGAYYPFVPKPDERERDDAAEFKLESVLDGELDVEDEKEYWYPLWPDGGDHPWEQR